MKIIKYVFLNSILLIFCIYFVNAQNQQKANDSLSFETFWKDFQTAFQNKNLDKISSMCNFPFVWSGYDQFESYSNKYKKDKFISSMKLYLNNPKFIDILSLIKSSNLKDSKISFTVKDKKKQNCYQLTFKRIKGNYKFVEFFESDECD
jgi:hypothetical protein